MKNPFLILLFSLFSFPCFSQYRLGAEAGVGELLFTPSVLKSQQARYSVTTNVQPCFTGGIYYLKRIAPYCYFGAKMYVEQNDFDYSYLLSNSHYYSSVDILHRSVYLFVAPTLDFAIGRKRYWHFYLQPAAGLMLAGSQTSIEDIDSYPFHQNQIDTTLNSASSIKRIIVHLNFGFRQYVAVDKDWQITFNEGLGVMLSHITSNTAVGTIHPGYVSIQMGVIRKYHKTHKEPAGNTPAQPAN